VPMRPWQRVTSSTLLAVGALVSFVRTEVLLVGVVAVLWLGWQGYRASAGLLAGSGVAASVLYVLAPADVTSPTSPLEVVLTLNGRTAFWGEVLRGPWDLLAGRGDGDVGTGLLRSGSSLWRPDGGGAVAPTGEPAALLFIDNSYLSVAADVGLPGLALVCAVLVLSARTLLAARPLTRPAVCGLGALLVIAVDGLTRSSLTQFPFGFIALLFLGTTLAAAQAAQSPGPRQAADQPTPARASSESRSASSGTAAGASS